ISRRDSGEVCYVQRNFSAWYHCYPSRRKYIALLWARGQRAHMNITDVERYFNDNNLMESTVIQYVYDPHRETVTLVCWYADDVVQALLHGARPPLNLTMNVVQLSK